MKPRLQDILTKQFLINCISDGLSQRMIAEKVEKDYHKRCSQSSVSAYCRKYGLEVSPKTTIDSGLDVDSLIEAYHTKLVADDVHYNIYTYESVYDKNKELSNDLINDLVILISDVHIGSLENADGFDSVPEKTVMKYIDTFCENLVKNLSKRNAIVKNTHVFFLGDIMDGELIFPAQRSIDMNEQLRIAIQVSKQIIETAKEISVHVNVYTVAGNHGRVSFRNSHKTNWDNVLYTTIRLIYSDDNRVTVDEGSNFIKIAEIGNKRILYTHGHFIRGNITKNKAVIKLNGWQSTFGKADMLVMGHFHSINYYNYNETPIITNGCSYRSDFVQFTLAGKQSLKFVVMEIGSKEDEVVKWIDFVSVV